MGLVEGIRGPDKVRFCELCQEYPLQLVGSFYGYGEDGRRNTSEPVEFSHLGPHCPVCEDRIEKGELNGRDPARASVD